MVLTGSLHVRPKVMRNLRPAPAFLTGDYVNRILGLLQELKYQESRPSDLAPEPNDVAEEVAAIVVQPDEPESAADLPAIVELDPAPDAPRSNRLTKKDRLEKIVAALRASQQRTAATAAPVPTRLVSGTPAPRAQLPVSWAEQRIAESERAIAFLRHRGFAVTRVLSTHSDEATGRFHVSSYRGEFDRTALIKLAEKLGMAR